MAMRDQTNMTLETDGVGDKDGASRRRIHLREISGDSESPLETVGQDLRAARLRRGDEIAQVSRALKIRKDHLEALENDRLEDLPGKTYAIGFVRSYARHLGLDSAQYVERFKQDISGRTDEQIREVHGFPGAVQILHQGDIEEADRDQSAANHAHDDGIEAQHRHDQNQRQHHGVLHRGCAFVIVPESRDCVEHGSLPATDRAISGHKRPSFEVVKSI